LDPLNPAVPTSGWPPTSTGVHAARARIVLRHGCETCFREGACLASLYDNVYLDLSYSIPFLSISEMPTRPIARL
jgi:hypothetical protein